LKNPNIEFEESKNRFLKYKNQFSEKAKTVFGINKSSLRKKQKQ